MGHFFRFLSRRHQKSAEITHQNASERNQLVGFLPKMDPDDQQENPFTHYETLRNLHDNIVKAILQAKQNGQPTVQLEARLQAVDADISQLSSQIKEVNGETTFLSLPQEVREKILHDAMDVYLKKVDPSSRSYKSSLPRPPVIVEMALPSFEDGTEASRTQRVLMTPPLEPVGVFKPSFHKSVLHVCSQISKEACVGPLDFSSAGIPPATLPAFNSFLEKHRLKEWQLHQMSVKVALCTDWISEHIDALTGTTGRNEPYNERARHNALPLCSHRQEFVMEKMNYDKLLHYSKERAGLRHIPIRSIELQPVLYELKNLLPYQRRGAFFLAEDLATFKGPTCVLTAFTNEKEKWVLPGVTATTHLPIGVRVAPWDELYMLRPLCLRNIESLKFRPVKYATAEAAGEQDKGSADLRAPKMEEQTVSGLAEPSQTTSPTPQPSRAPIPPEPFNKKFKGIHLVIQFSVLNWRWAPYSDVRFDVDIGKSRGDLHGWLERFINDCRAPTGVYKGCEGHIHG